MQREHDACIPLKTEKRLCLWHQVKRSQPIDDTCNVTLVYALAADPGSDCLDDTCNVTLVYALAADPSSDCQPEQI